jgi:hypothetical protein
MNRESTGKRVISKRTTEFRHRPTGRPDFGSRPFRRQRFHGDRGAQDGAPGLCRRVRDEWIARRAEFEAERDELQTMLADPECENRAVVEAELESTEKVLAILQRVATTTEFSRTHTLMRRVA